MNLEGRIDIHLQRHGDAPATVAIHSTRPQLAQKLLAGRRPEEAAHLAGLVFSLCGKAQRVAAEAACEAAQGLIPDAAVIHARETAVLLELAQEHAWRLLLDWPRQAGEALGIASDMPSLLRLRQCVAEPARFAETLDDLLRTTLLGEPADAWLARDLAGFDAWRHAGGTATARLFAELAVPPARKEQPSRPPSTREGQAVSVMPLKRQRLRSGPSRSWGGPANDLRGEGADSGISQASLLPPLEKLEDAAALELAWQALQHPAFCGQPLWQGEPAETGALARVHARPLLAAWIARRGRGAGARLLARMLELAELPKRLSALCSAGVPAGDAGATWVRAWSLGDNSGFAAVETSRGLLLHGVRLRDGKVAEYRIVAPTEWNFHPAGPLFQALSGLAPGDDLEARAQLVAQSLDPCVAFAIDVTDAK